MIEMGNEKIVTGRPNQTENETQYDVVSGLPSQNKNEKGCGNKI